MTRKEFEKIVQEAVDSLPVALRKKIDNVDIRVVESPNRRQAREWGGGREPSLYGLYEGIPQTERTTTYDLVPPDRITIFQRPIELAAGEDEEAIRREVRETVVHEIAHYYGITDERLDELGY